MSTNPKKVLPPGPIPGWNFTPPIQHLAEQFVSCKWQWTNKQIIAASPACIDTKREEQWRQLLRHFDPEDIIWCGFRRQTGHDYHANKFRTVDTWLKLKSLPGPLTCASTFVRGAYSRSYKMVVAHRFLVIGASGNDADVSTVIRWLHERVKLRLVAIVYSEPRLYGWFHHPGEDVVKDLKPVLNNGDINMGVYDPCHCWPLPGSTFFGDPKLIWLANPPVRTDEAVELEVSSKVKGN